VHYNFNQHKDELITLLTIAADHAFSAAGILNTTDITLIQAMTLYLESRCLKDGNRAIWSLTGVLVRTAIATGLHRDPTHFSTIRPFEAETRRRLWWHICFLDMRLGDSHISELSMTERMFDTKEPTNLSDVDFDIDVRQELIGRKGATEVTFCLLRCTLWKLVRRLQSLSTEQSQGAPNRKKHATYVRQSSILSSAFTAVHKIVQHIDLRRPLHSFLNGFARLAMLRAQLTVEQMHHSSGLVAPENVDSRKEWNRIFLLSVANLELEIGLRSNPRVKNWIWSMDGCLSWPAVSIILAQLCQRPWGSWCERAWTITMQYLDYIPPVLRKETLHRPIYQLAEDVRRHRGFELSRIRGDPEVARELDVLTAKTPLVDDNWLHSIVADGSIDIAAALEELEREQTVMTGSQVLGPRSKDASSVLDRNDTTVYCPLGGFWTPSTSGNSPSGFDDVGTFAPGTVVFADHGLVETGPQCFGQFGYDFPS
jgi:hypothetical protein